MKKILVNTLASTCLVLLLLILVAVIIDNNPIRDVLGAAIQVSVILQILAGNALVSLGLFFTSKFESKYAALEFLLDLSYIVIVILAFGIIFNWYTGRRWILATIVVVVYIFTLLTNMVRVRKETNEINELLQKRREKNIDTAS